jgi:hypothetical protein
MAGAMLAGVADASPAPASRPLPATAPARETPLVRVCHLRPRGKYWLGWPGAAWDVEGFTAKSRKLIEQFARDLKVNVAFESEPLYDAAAVDNFVASVQNQKPDGLIIFPLHMDQWPNVTKIQKAAACPTIIFAGLGQCFTGHLHGISRERGVYLASSADFELDPVRRGLKMIRARHDIRGTRIAVLVGDKTEDRVLDPFGVTVCIRPRRLFPETLKTISVNGEVEAMADTYRAAAQRIVEPSRDDVLNAARNYFCARRIMADHDCQGISMDCLGLVLEKQIPTPPCMAWCRLLDDGLLGVCEADINAVMSELLCLKLLDRPGFIQDPVPETVNNTFIGAHCVCGTRLNGFDQPPEPFILRSHAESDIGVSLQVLFKQGQRITIMQMSGPDKMLLGKGTVLRNLDTPPAGGCRTSVELTLDAPADTRDVKGFHQVFIYGDHVRTLQAYAQLYGIATESI